MRNCFRRGTIGEIWKQVEPDGWFNPAFQKNNLLWIFCVELDYNTGAKTLVPGTRFFSGFVFPSIIFSSKMSGRHPDIVETSCSSFGVIFVRHKIWITNDRV